MILIAHIVFAVASLVLTGVSCFTNGRRILTASYDAVALTLASGTYLVIADSSRLMSACLSGLFYLAVVGVGLFVAQHRRSTVSDK